MTDGDDWRKHAKTTKEVEELLNPYSGLVELTEEREVTAADMRLAKELAENNKKRLWLPLVLAEAALKQKDETLTRAHNNFSDLASSCSIVNRKQEEKDKRLAQQLQSLSTAMNCEVYRIAGKPDKSFTCITSKRPDLPLCQGCKVVEELGRVLVELENKKGGGK